jgi:hypothetical protein
MPERDIVKGTKIERAMFALFFVLGLLGVVLRIA